MNVKGTEGFKGDGTGKLGNAISQMLTSGIARIGWKAEGCDQLIISSTAGLVLKVTAVGDELCLEIV